MSTQPQQRSVNVPQQGEPSDWHWFRRKRGNPATPGDIALCGYVLGDNIQSHGTAAGNASGHTKWCPLCATLVEFVRDGINVGGAA